MAKISRIIRRTMQLDDMTLGYGQRIIWYCSSNINTGSGSGGWAGHGLDLVVVIAVIGRGVKTVLHRHPVARGRIGVLGQCPVQFCLYGCMHGLARLLGVDELNDLNYTGLRFCHRQN